jgi:ribosome-associated heat shock protein Hsp15
MKPEKEVSGVRIDKYLWAIRIFKSRSIASEAIDGGKVKFDGDSVKSSEKVKLGEKYRIKREQQVLEIEVIKIIEKRVSAALAQESYKEIFNSLSDLPKVQSAFYHSAIDRDKGKGRPTKRERREIDEFLDDETI